MARGSSKLSSVMMNMRKAPSHKGAKMVSGREKGVNKALPKSLRGGKHRARGR